MAHRRLRLHYRIVIPFVLIAVVIPAVAAFISLSLVIRSLEARVATQVQKTAAVISHSDFALNASILARVKAITDIDVITFTTSGAILASTLDHSRGAGLAASVTASDATRDLMSAADGTSVLQHTECAGIPCYLAYQRVPARSDAIIALMLDTSELSAATATITRTILLSAVLSIVVMVFVGQMVTRRVTGPLEQLVAFTHDASPGVSRRRAVIADDEIGQLAMAFNQMLDRLDGAQDALVRSEKLAVTGLLAARVAHDIRNPLSSIKMQTQLLFQSRMSAEQAKPLLQAMLRDIDQVEAVVRDLLELARPGTLKLASADLNDTVSDVLKQLAPQMTHRKIAVAPDFAPALPPILLDADRFKQAVLNVSINAADAMPFGGTLRVATRAIDAGSTLMLEISDDGVGVPPEILNRVFDPFVSSKHEGVGLGLVNAKAVIDGHGGRISLTPRQPKGTCVTIWLPVCGMEAASKPGASCG